MSLQGPIVVVADTPRAELADILSAAGAFPLVEAGWGEAAAAIDEIRPAAVVLDGEPPFAAVAGDVAAAAAAGGAYVPIVACLAADRAPPLPHALPVAPQARADVLIARLRAALRVRTLSSTALRRQETLADHGRVMASLPVGDPLDDATVLVAGRGGRYPALTTAVGSRLGLIGAFSLETALGYLNARDVDAVVIGDGFNRTMVDTFLAELGLDPRWRDLPVLVLDEVGIDIDPERMPLFDRVDGGAELVAARVAPFARLHALSSRLRRLVAALDAKGLIDPETGLLTADAFMRDLGRAMTDATDSGTGLAIARISLDTLGEPRASRDAARIVGRLTRTGDFACRDRDGTILVAFVETDLTTAHVVARRIASVLKHTTLAPGRDRSGLDPTVVLASLKARDSIDTLVARVGIERLVAAG